jgi:hypothetical protein
MRTIFASKGSAINPASLRRVLQDTDMLDTILSAIGDIAALN